MGFVAAAYLVVVGLFVLYALTVAGRQRLIGDLADAALHDAAAAAAPRDPVPR